MEAGGKPMTAPLVMPKLTQKAMACMVFRASDQKMSINREDMNWAPICIFSWPVLSQKAAMVSRPKVEAPFKIARSQKVWRGASLGETYLMGATVPSRVPKPDVAAHCLMLGCVSMGRCIPDLPPQG